MSIYKESMLNKIEDDLQGRNQNWDILETHLADYETHKADYETHKAESAQNWNTLDSHLADNTAHGLGNFLPKAIFSGWYNGSRSVTLQRGRGYIVVTSGHNEVLSSLHLVGSTSTQQRVTPVLTGSSINVTIDSDMTLTITTSGTASVAVIQFY